MSRSQKKESAVPESGGNAPQTPAAVSSAAPATAPLGSVSANRLDFLWKTHSYISEYIRFADTKATVVIALSTGLLAALLATKAHHWCAPSTLSPINPVWKDTWLGAGACSAYTLLVLAFICAILALSPRLWSTQVAGLWETLKHLLFIKTSPAKHERGYVFWDQILVHGSAEQFWNDFLATPDSVLEEHLGKRLFILSAIAHDKYFYANRSIFFLFLGALIAGLFILGSS
jgi:hypothetical protein